MICAAVPDALVGIDWRHIDVHAEPSRSVVDGIGDRRRWGEHAASGAPIDGHPSTAPRFAPFPYDGEWIGCRPRVLMINPHRWDVAGGW